MQELMVRPTVYRFQQCVEFAGQFRIGKGDLILTNESIYQSSFASLNLDRDVIYQERYGTGEPTDVMAEAIAGNMNPQCRRIIAIGGGTILDIARILALDTMLPIEELYGGKRSITRSRELILVPTTRGTGSEMTNIVILALARRNTKKGLAYDSMYADAAVLIPELLKHLPFHFFATSSIDTLIHATESSLSPRSNETLRLFSYRVISMILNGYQEITARGADARLEHPGEFLLASTYVGIAFGSARCGAVHAMSYPLGVVCHVPHGEASYAMLTGVIEKYMELKSDGQIQKLNRHMASVLGCEEQDTYQELERLLNVLLPRKSLKEYGVTEEELQTFTDSVMTEQGRLMSSTSVPLSRQRVYEIYRHVY